MEYVLEMKDISKTFPGVKALDHVQLQVRPGEVHALMGENGAGKSTLMKILMGIYTKDPGGEILFDGKPYTAANPKEAMDTGVAMIHQELNPILDMTVYENIFVGRELRKNGLVDKKAEMEEAQKLIEECGLHVSPKETLRNLTVAQCQLIEIIKAISVNAKIIIMDEPTTSLTDPEIEKVFTILRQLREQQVGIVFISHKLREVMEICDSYTVLRDGVMVASGSVKDVTTSDLARFMVGHDVRTEKLDSGAQRGEERLSLRGVTQEPYFRNVDLTAYAGEVLGVTGLLGDGRSELFSAVFGAETISEGEIRLGGKPVRITSTWQAKQLGIAYVPRNRKENGIIKDMSILENGTIVSWRELMRHGLLDHVRQRAQFEKEKAALHIKMGKESDSITSLSGGNQQKVVLAKWLSCEPKVLILDNPTQGVDVGAKEEIYDIILKLAKEGVAVIVLSSEAQEIIRVCDRALVMYHGAIVGEVRGETMTEHEIMRLATGG